MQGSADPGLNAVHSSATGLSNRSALASAEMVSAMPCTEFHGVLLRVSGGKCPQLGGCRRRSRSLCSVSH